MKPTSQPKSRWDDPEALERALAESAQRVEGLSPQQRARVRRALVAESAALRQRRRWVPALRVGLALAVLSVAVSLYLLFGGTRAPSGAVIDGTAALREQRQGPLGVRWWLDQEVRPLRGFPLAVGDEFTAAGSVTVTLADGSTLFAAPGAHVRVLGRNAFFLDAGELTNVIAPQAREAGFHLETRAGLMQVRGTVFRAHVLDKNTAREFTDEGIVSVRTALGSAEVITGEQAVLSTSQPLTVELQVPRVRIASASPDRVLVNTRTLQLQAFLYPGATLIAYDGQHGNVIGTLRADAGGVLSGTLTLPEGVQLLAFEQLAPDGRRSARSLPIEVVVDMTNPALRIERVSRSGAQVRVIGQAEVGAVVRINGQIVPTDARGAFDFTFVLQGDTVTITATDPAGNITFAVQRVR